jgi:hypothetical protein
VEYPRPSLYLNPALPVNGRWCDCFETGHHQSLLNIALIIVMLHWLSYVKCAIHLKHVFLGLELY